ncbi:hypothetical protein Tco_0888831, partial [Tanacetum coccineum]
ETVYKEWEDRMERAATTASSLEAEQDNGNINRTQSMATLNESFPQGTDSNSGPRVNTLGSGEDSMKLMELMEHCTTLSELFWATAKVKTVNGERQLQALVDKKKVIITETSIRSDLHLEDAGGTDCLRNPTIFEELARMGAKTTAWNEFSSTMASLGDMSHHKKTYVNPSHIKKIFANMKREGKDFSGRVTPLFATMMVQANQEEGADSAIPTDSQQTPIISQPSSSKPQKKKSRRKQRKDSAPTEPTTEETPDEAHVSTLSCDLPQSGEDRMKLIELMNLCTQLQSRVLALENTKSNQDLEIESLKRRVKSLEKRRKSRTPGFKRLRKVGSASRVESSNDAILGVLEEQEKDMAEKEVSAADTDTTAGEVVTIVNVEVTTVNASTTTIDELTLAYTLIEIKVAKPKAAVLDITRYPHAHTFLDHNSRHQSCGSCVVAATFKDFGRISSISIGSSNVQPSEFPYFPVLCIGTSQIR